MEVTFEERHVANWRKKLLRRQNSRCKGPEALINQVTFHRIKWHFIKSSETETELFMDTVESRTVIDRSQMCLFHSVSLLLCSYCLPHQQFARCCQQITFTCGQHSPFYGSIKASSENSGHFCWAPCGRAKKVCEWAGTRGLWGSEETAGNYRLWAYLSMGRA